MHEAGAPWLTLGRRLMCLPETIKIKIRTNTCTNMLCIHKTKLQIALSRRVSTLLRGLVRRNETYKTPIHKAYTQNKRTLL